MKTVLILGLALSLAACGSIDRWGARITGSSKTCVDGVSYIQFPSGASVQYDRNGKIVAC